MKVIVSDFDGTLFCNDKIVSQDKINKFVINGNYFIIATGRNMTSLKKELDKFILNPSFYICNDGALILDQFFNIIYRTDIDNSMIRPLYNELKNDDNILEVLIDTGNGYIDDISRSANKLIARYYSKEKAISLVNRINSRYPSVFGYVSKNWINITKRTETKGKAVKFLSEYYNFNKYPIYIIGNDVNDISMCNYDFVSYGIDCKENELYIDHYQRKAKNFEEAFDEIVNIDNENI